ncbi:unnamed protein product [Phytophthora lilii]|uniref:Unnamed protein product n=1 Tax=Phytophthora lilii TaxID=2077276 RepID=A0A9W6U5U0_9STRA|nr:unnamed protein product [Phytophthora lilii]
MPHNDVPTSHHIAIYRFCNTPTHAQPSSLKSGLSSCSNSSHQSGEIMRPVNRYFTLLLASISVSSSTAGTPSTCRSALGGSFSSAVVAYPNLKEQIELVAKQQVAQWYTDRVWDTASLAKSVVLPICNDASQDSSPPTIVIYGLPQKDCAHGFSTSGSNSNTNDYRAFLQQLADAAGTQQVVYILEPDAIGLLADDGCGIDKGYADNLGVAMDILSQNSNAEIYLDVGYWTLSNDEQAAAVAKIVNSVDPNCKTKGISLNTSNYRSNAEMAATCERFVKASGRDYKCVVDSSRNFVSPPSKEWCNANWAGIGELPTSNTDSEYVSRYVWVKPPGESDGECTGQSDQALRGPNAGNFFPGHFVQLWDNGVFVQKLGMTPINIAANTTSNTTVIQAETPASTTTAPPAEQVSSQEIELTSLAALDVSDETLGQVHAGDDDDDNYETSTPTSVPTTPAPTTWSPVAVEVNPPHTMVVVDVVPDEYSYDDSDDDFTSVDQDAERIRKHKACE